MHSGLQERFTADFGGDAAYRRDFFYQKLSKDCGCICYGEPAEKLRLRGKVAGERDHGGSFSGAERGYASGGGDRDALVPVSLGSAGWQMRRGGAGASRRLCDRETPYRSAHFGSEADGSGVLGREGMSSGRGRQASRRPDLPALSQRGRHGKHYIGRSHGGGRHYSGGSGKRAGDHCALPVPSVLRSSY